MRNVIVKKVKKITMQNYTGIPNITSQISFLYIEHAYIHIKDSSILIIQKDRRTPIPSHSLACLILGPGTNITHAAISALQKSGCLICWEGENQRVFYAYGMQENRKSKNILKQIDYYSNKQLHMQIVKKMYQKRFPTINLSRKSLSQLRGMEGARVKEQYEAIAIKYDITWKSRKYKQGSEGWNEIDLPNKAITIGNKLLYNVCHAVILALGYSPTIGFIHTGTMRSFVYDISDLYKLDFVIEPAFRTISNTDSASEEEDIRTEIRKTIYEKRLIQQIVDDLNWLFDEDQKILVNDEGLWDSNKNIVSYGRNWSNVE